LAISNCIFCYMFRMPRDSFNWLCKLIEAAVGRVTFKLELWIADRVLPCTNDVTNLWEDSFQINSRLLSCYAF
jgi:hypothetical protein